MAEQSPATCGDMSVVHTKAAERPCHVISAHRHFTFLSIAPLSELPSSDQPARRRAGPTIPTLDPNPYTVAWIAPLEIEVQAALQMLDKVHRGGFPVSPGDDYVFHAGKIQGTNIVNCHVCCWPTIRHKFCNSSRKLCEKIFSKPVVWVASGCRCRPAESRMLPAA
ncbi:hypothetical protein BDW66DRAFT_11537 [Aspergillus desertorum]